MASAEQVRDLRGKTGAGIMECKRALVEAKGDLEQAIDILRKQGIVKAAKKAHRVTHEGRVDIAVSAAGDKAAIVEVNCETDFVGRTDAFQGFVSELAKHALATGIAELDAFMPSPYQADSNKTVSDALKDIIAKVGENISVARIGLCNQEQANEKIDHYIHAGNQIGVLVKVQGDRVADEAVRDVAMHVAAMNPTFVSPDDVPGEVTAKEKEILKASPDMAGKPDDVVDKMINGRFRKFLSQVCLTEQIFIKDPQGKQTVGAYLDGLDSDARITSFIRYQVGEKSAS